MNPNNIPSEIVASDGTIDYRSRVCVDEIFLPSFKTTLVSLTRSLDISFSISGLLLSRIDFYNSLFLKSMEYSQASIIVAYRFE